jgi:hypothetical protein
MRSNAIGSSPLVVIWLSGAGPGRAPRYWDRGSRGRDEVYSKRVPAGKRTYFFDVKATRSGEDFFVTITESKRVDEGRYEKHKIFLYKEDFGKFVTAMHEVIRHIRDDRLPEYDFRGLPDIEEDTSEKPASGSSHFDGNGHEEITQDVAESERQKED